MDEKQEKDPFIGLIINNNWKLIKKVGSGKVGHVYKAVRENPSDILACKIIPGAPKQGWDRELQKVTKLRGVSNVVQYHSHGPGLLPDNTSPFVWILWNDFVDGINLKEFIKDNPWPLDMAFIENIAGVILDVLYACQVQEIIHGDLHAGNILISNPDVNTIEKKRRIWVSDFGYGGSHNLKKPKDDYLQLTSIIVNLLEKLKPSSLNKRDKVMHQKMLFFFRKKFMENDPTQGNHVRNLELLIKEYKRLPEIAKQEAEYTERNSIKEPGDYLWAEALGNKVEEWKMLFVPEFLAAKDLLNKNITILTGARGCGKTMAFKRMTAYMDKVIGEPSGVIGSAEFTGFYLNCRNLIEAFPWIPEKLNNHISAQIIHYFHLSWLSEVCSSLHLCFEDNGNSYPWLETLVQNYFKTYQPLPEGSSQLPHIMSFIEIEKERCRLTEFNKIKDLDWPLYKMNFLDELQIVISQNSRWPNTKPFYFFIDDYTIPIIPRSVQQVLNPIIFKRRDNLFFKISTESVLSFEKTSVRGKPLELHQDFELIDLASETLHQEGRQKAMLLEKIFKPRIDRHIFLGNQNLTLSNVLGTIGASSNELAWLIRGAANNGAKKRIVYHGIEAFIGMWASDIRIMIQMFVDMLRRAHFELEKGKTVIDPKIQNDVYRTTGGEFLVFTESVPAPSTLERSYNLRRNLSFGTHLVKVVESFINISRHELQRGPLINNQGRRNPKQAFRLEIIDKFNLSNEVKDYYEGLVRWHIFLHDWRGKSVRGMITPRLFLNRVLIPNAQLTFSSHDNIHMTNHEFNRFLKDPVEFAKSWKNKKYNRNSKNQTSFGFKN